MGVYIKGMEMPTNCHECQLVDVLPTCPCRQMADEDFWRDVSLSVEGHKDCPLVPVPPHGRLGDLDALIDELPNNLGIRGLEYLNRQESAIVSWIYAAPTIIPASEEVYDKYTDTAGNLHWMGTHSGKHIVKAEESE